MEIINPIYDSAFKYLINNNQIAKMLISAIIGEEIEQLLFTATETQVPIKKEVLNPRTNEIEISFMTVLRIDFSAQIKKSDGSIAEVLIEIQKAKFSSDISRFRRYLGERYSSSQASIANPNDVKPIPIVTIYFLGTPLEHTVAPIIKTAKNTYDVINMQELTEKEEFIECLTHDCYVIQIPFLKARHRNDLEDLLSIFDQNNTTSDKHILNIKVDDIPERYRSILRRLQDAMAEAEIRRQMKIEDEIIDELKNHERVIEEQKKEIEEERRQKEEERRQKELAEQKAEEERSKKELAEQKTEEVLSKVKNLVLKWHQKDKSVTEIAENLEMEQAEVEKILKEAKLL